MSDDVTPTPLTSVYGQKKQGVTKRSIAIRRALADVLSAGSARAQIALW